MKNCNKCKMELEENTKDMVYYQSFTLSLTAKHDEDIREDIKFDLCNDCVDEVHEMIVNVEVRKG